MERYEDMLARTPLPTHVVWFCSYCHLDVASDADHLCADEAVVLSQPRFDWRAL